jgi:hypothetical protein
VGAIPPELWINIAILAVLLGYLLLGIANKLIATTAGRRPELAALQLPTNPYAAVAPAAGTRLPRTPRRPSG